MLILAALLVSNTGVSTAAYAVQQAIPLGPLTVAVDGWEDITDRSPAPLTPLAREAEERGERLIMVRIRSWGHPETPRRRDVRQVLLNRLTLTDADGLTYSVLGAVADPATQDRLSSDDQPPSGYQWALLFQVWGVSEGYALQVGSNDAVRRAPRTAVVRLQPERSQRPLLAGQPSHATRRP